MPHPIFTFCFLNLKPSKSAHFTSSLISMGGCACFLCRISQYLLSFLVHSLCCMFISSPYCSFIQVFIDACYAPNMLSGSVQFSPVTQLCLTLCNPNGLQHTRLPCPSPTPRACSNSCPLSRGCHPTISSSVVPFFSCLQSFPASASFPVSQFFASGGQSIGVLYVRY